MRQRVSTIGFLILLSTLLLSGWGNLIASTLCPHVMDQTKTMAEGHACCINRPEAAATLAPSASQMSEHKAVSAWPDAYFSVGEGVNENCFENQSLALGCDSCAHCGARQSDLPIKSLAYAYDGNAGRRFAALFALPITSQLLPLDLRDAPSHLRSAHNTQPFAPIPVHIRCNVFRI
jgi:hypothetical protein